MMDITIVGVGGVGSWVAEFLARQDLKHEFIGRMTIIDHDKVEETNLQRQNYTKDDLREEKVVALKNKLNNIGFRKVKALPIKLETKEQIVGLDTSGTWVLSTDDIRNKTMLSKLIRGRLYIANCDYDFAEVKTETDVTDEKAWVIRNGYTSMQDISSNIRTAQIIATSIISGYLRNVKVKVQSEFEQEDKAVIERVAAKVRSAIEFAKEEGTTDFDDMEIRLLWYIENTGY